MAFATVSELLKVGKDGDPALGAPETKALDYAGLRALTAATVGDLNAMGSAATIAWPSCCRTARKWRRRS
jgi:hypothetical protein